MSGTTIVGALCCLISVFFLLGSLVGGYPVDGGGVVFGVFGLPCLLLGIIFDLDDWMRRGRSKRR